MKNKMTLKGLALGVMLTLTTVSFAGEGDTPSAKITIFPYLHTNYSLISINGSLEGSGVFTVADENGYVLYKELLENAESAQKVVDFSKLEDGNYSVKLKFKGFRETSEEFTIRNHKVVSGDSKKLDSPRAKSFANLNDNMLYVSHLPFDQSNFNIIISTDSDDTLYKKSIESDNAYSGKFDISNLPSGDYKLKINSGDKEYSYAFSKY